MSDPFSRVAFAIVGAVAVLSGVSHAEEDFVARTAALRAEVMALEKQILKLSEEGDKTAIAPLTADDYVQIDGVTRVGKTEALEMIMKVEPENRWQIEDMTAIALTPDAVVVSYRLKFKDAASIMISSCWAKRGGKWLNVVVHTSVDSTDTNESSSPTATEPAGPAASTDAAPASPVP